MTDVVTHAEVLRAQQQLVQLQADIASARQEIAGVKQAAAGSVVKRVQRGVVSIGGSGGASVTRDVTVAAVDMNKSVLHFLGTGGLNYSGGGLMALGVLELVNATTVHVWPG